MMRPLFELSARANHRRDRVICHGAHNKHLFFSLLPLQTALIHLCVIFHQGSIGWKVLTYVMKLRMLNRLIGSMIYE
jgi:hypothetical protein